MGVIVPRKIVAFETWQEGISIHAGYSVFIHFKSGNWNINPGKHTKEDYGPEGSKVIASDDKYPMPGEKEGCLIGRLLFQENYGKNGISDISLKKIRDNEENSNEVMFTVGRDGILIPKTDYPKVLQLRCNDIDTGVFDNVGELQIELEIW